MRRIDRSIAYILNNLRIPIHNQSTKHVMLADKLNVSLANGGVGTAEVTR